MCHARIECVLTVDWRKNLIFVTYIFCPSFASNFVLQLKTCYCELLTLLFFWALEWWIGVGLNLFTNLSSIPKYPSLWLMNWGSCICVPQTSIFFSEICAVHFGSFCTRSINHQNNGSLNFWSPSAVLEIPTAALQSSRGSAICHLESFTVLYRRHVQTSLNDPVW